MADADEFALCKSRGYPQGTDRSWNQDCYKIGSYSNPQKIFLHNTAQPGTQPWSLQAGSPLFDPATWTYGKGTAGATGTVDNYLQTYRVTGFLILKDDKVVFERYQYGRSPSNLMLSHSMSKTVMALLYGHAINDGKISLADKVVDVLPDFAGTAFANDSVEDLLRMSSGAALVNSYTGPADNGATNPMNLQGGGDLRAILKSKTATRAQAGAVFDYNGMQSALLGLMLRERLEGRTLTAYLEEKIWKPMGAEYPAVWIKDKQGYEGVQGQFAASVRDYAKLGSLFVNKGVANGKQVIPASWIEAMTRIDRSKPQPTNGTFYGLHVWLTSQGQGRGRFAGTYGQHIAFDPVAKLVMVQTAAAKTADDEGSPHFFAIRNSLAASLAVR